MTDNVATIYETCPACDGRGYWLVPCIRRDGTKLKRRMRYPCPRCSERGATKPPQKLVIPFDKDILPERPETADFTGGKTMKDVIDHPDYDPADFEGKCCNGSGLVEINGEVVGCPKCTAIIKKYSCYEPTVWPLNIDDSLPF